MGMNHRKWEGMELKRHPRSFAFYVSFIVQCNIRYDLEQCGTNECRRRWQSFNDS